MIINCKLEDSAKVPLYATEDSAAFDFESIETNIIYPNKTEFFKTGVKVQLPKGYFLGIYNRSGLSCKHGVVLANNTGIIDADYRGEILIALHNHSNTRYIVSKGDRIAQGIIQPYVKAYFTSVNSISDSDRGEGGFGHTGR